MRIRKFTSATFLLLGALSTVFSEGVIAATLMELKKADKVRIKTWIEPRENIIARQRVDLQIEIATDTRFTRGTRIGVPDVKDAIVLRRENFAVNSTRNEGGRNWAVQQWTLVVYPQRDGVFEIPAISMRLSIAGEGLESVVGELETLPLRFVANTPESMHDKANWIATTRFEVNEHYDKSFDDLKPGDAVVRSISMSVDDLPAMMLPDIVVDNLPGIAVYPKPPRLEDTVNRGNYLAERTQVITYVFEKSGDYQLQKQTFYWWNLETQSIETIEVNAQIIEVRDLFATGDMSIKGQQPTEQQSTVELALIFKKIGVVFVFVIITGVIIHRLSKIQTRTREQADPLSEKALRKQFEAACHKNNLESAMGLLYKWLDNYGGKRFSGSVREQLAEINGVQLTVTFKSIMRTIYMSEQNDEIDLKLFANQFIGELRKLERRSVFDRFYVEFKLNG